MESKGETHPGCKKAASAIFEDSIYLFGGEDGDGNSTGALTILTTEGDFQKVKPKWEAPWPRHEHRGWSYNGSLYFLGGRVKTTKEQIDQEGISANFEIRRPRKKGDPVTFYTNQLLQFDPVENVISHVVTSGSIPRPRSDFAIATLEKGQRVIVHGGYCGEVLADLFELDTKTRIWTKLSFFEQSLSFHTLVPISAAEVLIYGGNPSEANAISNELWIIDLDQKQKKPNRIESRDKRFETPYAGMKGHRAVVQSKERGAFVFCLGGYADKGLGSHPDHMLVFEVFHPN
ncbi:MAG: kelch repeat-containing protein [SAR324 cluster bacterium]|nr:kelch repeat-containing protein [SAR324 cluster bacterium]